LLRKVFRTFRLRSKVFRLKTKTAVSTIRRNDKWGIKLVLEVHPGDVVKLKKQHPCGGFEWEVVRIGADIGIVCRQCQRRVLLPRSVFERRVKEFISRDGNAT
jgi:hypothetical protein